MANGISVPQVDFSAPGVRVPQIQSFSAPDFSVDGVDVASSIAKGQAASSAIREGRRASEIAALREQIDPSDDIANDPAMARLAVKDPVAAQRIITVVGGLSKERARGLYQDVDKGVRLLEADKKEAFVNLMVDRQEQVERLGGESQDIDTIIDLAQNNKWDQAQALLTAAQQDGFALGLITPAKKDHFEKAPGGLVFNKTQGVYTIDPVAVRRQEQIADAAARRKALTGKNLDFKDKQGLNKDVTSILKDTVGISRSAEELNNLQKLNSPAAKLGAVFKFMKSLDPTSVVRESEQGQVYSAQGAGAQIAGALNQLIGTGQLTNKGFADLVRTAQTIANTNIDSVNGEVTNLLSSFGDSIPEKFKSDVLKRVPRPFRIAPRPEDAQTITTQPRQVITPTQTVAPPPATNRIRFDAQGNLIQ